MLRAVSTLAATLVVVATTPVSAAGGGDLYAEPDHWLCRPDHGDDVCDAGLDATIVDADGTLTVDPFVP